MKREQKKVLIIHDDTCDYMTIHVIDTCDYMTIHVITFILTSCVIANIKLSEMNSELSKAQEHAHRFQDLLTTERRKQKALQVHV